MFDDSDPLYELNIKYPPVFDYTIDDYPSRQYIACFIGLEAGPATHLTFNRGCTKANAKKQIKQIKLSIAGLESPLETIQKFAKSSDSECFLAFYEDCKELENPIDNISSEWNILSNWHLKSCHKEEFKKVWDRVKVPYNKAIEIIAKSKPLPPPPIKAYKANKNYKKRIDYVSSEIQPITEEQIQTYKLVYKQNRLRSILNIEYWNLAAEKFRELLSTSRWDHIDPKPPHVIFSENYLKIQQSQYDDWNGWYEFLKKHCKISEWKDRNYDSFPIATWDLSNDPDFANSEQKVFPIRICYYDSHWSGY